MINCSILIEDRLAAGLAAKLDLAGQLLFGNLECGWDFAGYPFDRLPAADLEQCRRLLLAANKKIVLLDCPLPLSDPEPYRLVFRQAHLLGIEQIRVPFDHPDDRAGLKTIDKIGRTFDIGVVIENAAGSYLADEKAAARLIRETEGVSLAFNPLEFVRCQRHPFFHVFYQSKLKNQIRFLRINDGLYADGSPVPLLTGNAEIKELASILLSRSFKGYFSLTAYMPDMTRSGLEETIGRFRSMLQDF